MIDVIQYISIPVAIILIYFLLYEVRSSMRIKEKIASIKDKAKNTKAIKKLSEIKRKKKKIYSTKDHLRSLSNESGGLEVDYEKSQKEIEEDLDPWDKNFDEANVSIEEEEEQETGLEFDSSNYKAFIYKKKKKGKGKSMGKMKLGEDEEHLGHVEKLNNLRKSRLDHENNDGSGIGF